MDDGGDYDAFYNDDGDNYYGDDCGNDEAFKEYDVCVGSVDCVITTVVPVIADTGY